ncbi:MAG: hypothetical protein IT281_09485 [Ignavibacteria bacterium]|nr:hypothetical protein [Ignavibacteria bacterium]MCC7159758.1 hypothetical protein [Ignavibacteria bacterium]
MRIRIVTVFLLSFLVASSSSFSQTKTVTNKLKKPAAFMIEWNFSYSQPLPNMSGDVGEQFTFKNYGVKMGFGTQIYMKLNTEKKGRIRPYFMLGYDLFMNSDNSTAFIGANILNKWPDIIGSTPGKSKMYLHNFSAAVGFEYAFVNKSTWTPYANFDFGLNILFGTYKQTPNSTGGEVSFTYKQAPRLGIGFGGGVNGRLTKAFGLAIGVKYKLPNLLLKDSKSTNEQNKLNINDKEDASLSSNLTKDRTMMYLQFYVGATFFIGRK